MLTDGPKRSANSMYDIRLPAHNAPGPARTVEVRVDACRWARTKFIVLPVFGALFAMASFAILWVVAGRDAAVAMLLLYVALLAIGASPIWGITVMDVHEYARHNRDAKVLRNIDMARTMIHDERDSMSPELKAVLDELLELRLAREKDATRDLSPLEISRREMLVNRASTLRETEQINLLPNHPHDH